MRVGKFLTLFRRNPDLTDRLSAEDRSDVVNFLDSLQVVSEWDLAEFASAAANLKRPRHRTVVAAADRPKTSETSNKANAALAELKALEVDLPTWPGADYDRVKNRVYAICEPLSIAELEAVSLSLLKKKNRKKKNDMIADLRLKFDRQLELKGMGAST